MSITDATGSLTTAWTEQSTVDFTAGTLSTISDCVSEVESRLKRGTLSSSTSPTSTQVQNWLIYAKQLLVEKKGFTFARRFATASTVAGTYRYGLPPDYNGGLTVLKDTTSDHHVPIWLDHQFNIKYPDPSAEAQGEPVVACVKNLELWLSRPADSVYTLELEYERSGDDNTQTDFSWLPQIERFRCCDYAAFRGFMDLHMWNEGSMYERLWNQGIGEAIRADGKRKWKSMNYQMIDMITEYRARK